MSRVRARSLTGARWLLALLWALLSLLRPVLGRFQVPRALLHPHVLAVGLLWGGFALRLPSATHQLEYDEVIAILFGRHSFGEIVQATAADTMPPLYYWLLHLWTPDGSVFMARMLNVLFGTLTLAVFYALARRLAGQWQAVGALAIATLSPLLVFYGHYARMYALLTLCGMVAVYGFVQWLRTDRPRPLVVFTVAAAVAMWTHPLAALVVAALDLAFVLGRDEWSGGSFSQRARALAVAHVAIGLAYAPWLAYLPGQLDKVNTAFWIGRPGAAELLRTVVMWHFNLPLPPGVLPLLAFLALALAAATGIETWRRWRTATTQVRQQILLAGALTLAPVGMMFVVSQLRPVYVERAVLLSAFGYYLLLAGALAHLRLRPLAFGLAGGLWAGLLLGLLYQERYEGFPRSPYLPAATLLRQTLQPGDLVLHDNKLSFFPMHYFAPDMPQRYLPDLPGTANDTLAPGTTAVLGLPPTPLADAADGARDVWYVVFDRALVEAARTGVAHQYRSWLDQHLTPAGEQQVGDLRLLHYRTAEAR